VAVFACGRFSFSNYLRNENVNRKINSARQTFSVRREIESRMNQSSERTVTDVYGCGHPCSRDSKFAQMKCLYRMPIIFVWNKHYRRCISTYAWMELDFNTVVAIKWRIDISCGNSWFACMWGFVNNYWFCCGLSPLLMYVLTPDETLI